MTMAPLHRHQLAWLDEAAWQSVQARSWDATARDCLAYWAAENLPLLVARQAAPVDEEDEYEDGHAITLGLPAPGGWNRRRLALDVTCRNVLFFDEFPPAETVRRWLPVPPRAWIPSAGSSLISA